MIGRVVQFERLISHCLILYNPVFFGILFGELYVIFVGTGRWGDGPPVVATGLLLADQKCFGHCGRDNDNDSRAPMATDGN